MKLTGKIFNLVLSLWAVAILWICIGTLVNFHQHKIWGKPLLPELLYAKRDKEQTIDLAKLIDPDLAKDITPWTPDYLNGLPAYASIQVDGISSFFYIKTAIPFPEKRFMISPGLRAPPVS